MRKRKKNHTYTKKKTINEKTKTEKENKWGKILVKVSEKRSLLK